MYLTVVSKHTPRSLAISAVCSSCLGGIWLGMGIKN
jgi:hypothetical protein